MVAWRHAAEVASIGFCMLYACDRLIKLAMVTTFMRASPCRSLPSAPSVSLIQPITLGASDLAGNLAARLRLAYPGPIEHVLVCDDGDKESAAVCRAVFQLQNEYG